MGRSARKANDDMLGFTDTTKCSLIAPRPRSPISGQSWFLSLNAGQAMNLLSDAKDSEGRLLIPPVAANSGRYAKTSPYANTASYL